MVELGPSFREWRTDRCRNASAAARCAAADQNSHLRSLDAFGCVYSRTRPGSLRRVQPMERCRIVAPRESLDRLKKAIGPKATAGAEQRAIAHLKPLLNRIRD